MPKFHFTLYVFGNNRNAERTRSNVRRLLDEVAENEYELKVCDVLAEPQAAEEGKILATPTLVLTSPPPPRMIVGDLFDTDRILRYFDGLFREPGG